VHHGLLVAGQHVGQRVLLLTALVLQLVLQQGLPEPGDVAVPEDAEAPGEEPLPLAVARKSVEEGDIRRADRQQQLLRALVAEAMKPSNLIKADEIVETGFSQIETDLTRAQVLALATIFKGKTSGMASASLPGDDVMEGGIYYWRPNPERSLLTLEWILNGNEASGRKLIRAAVSNASGVQGAALRASEEISGVGYSSFSAGNARKRLEESLITYRKAAHREAALEIAKMLGIRRIEKEDVDPRADWLPELRVTIGADVAPRLTNTSSAG
jgi:hypothetical protein